MAGCPGKIPIEFEKAEEFITQLELVAKRAAGLGQANLLGPGEERVVEELLESPCRDDEALMGVDHVAGIDQKFLFFSSHIEKYANCGMLTEHGGKDDAETQTGLLTVLGGDHDSLPIEIAFDGKTSRPRLHSDTTCSAVGCAKVGKRITTGGA